MNTIKPATINVRVDPTLKNEVIKLLESLGMTISEAVNVYLRQIVLHNGIPFAIQKPPYNFETEEAMNEVNEMIKTGNAKKYNSADALFDDLEV